MCSSPPGGAPKSQLDVKQPSTGGCWKPPPPKEDTPCPKRRKKPQRDRRRSTITIKSSHMPARWVTCTVEHSSTKEVLLLWEDRIMLPSLGV